MKSSFYNIKNNKVMGNTSCASIENNLLGDMVSQFNELYKYPLSIVILDYSKKTS